MKKTLFLLLIFVPGMLFAQKKMTAKNININFDKVIHLVMSSDIAAVTSGSKNIEAEIVKEKPNIARIAAMEEDFVGTINVTLVLGNGKIHTFNVSYQKELPEQESVYYPDMAREKEDYRAIVNTTNVTHLVFPNEIIYLKQGNSEVITATITATPNIVQLSALEEPIYETNIFAVDKTGNYYNIIINSGQTSSYVYDFSSDDDDANEITAQVIINEDELQVKCQKAITGKRTIYSCGVSQTKYEFSLNNIYVDEKLLYFVFELKNKSNIDFDVDFVKCLFLDKKRAKNAIQQEDVVEYKYNLNFPNKISAKSANKFVMAFEKFTIPDKKIFKIEIYEKNGGRNINFTVENNIIMGALSL